MIKYSIIVPVYKHLKDCTKPCLQSIINTTDLSNVEIIVVANGCGDDGTKEFIKSLNGPFKLIWFEEPLGYTRATNEGIKVAAGEYIVLLNNDAFLLEWQPQNLWLNCLEAPFLRDPKIAITGPRKLYSGPPFCNEGVNMFFIVFFCAMIRRETFQQFGLLDEIFSPGSGEDIDFSIKVQLAGYKTEEVPIDFTNPYAWQYRTTFPIYHKAEATVFDLPNWGEIYQRNQNILMERYAGWDNKKSDC